ncbi:GGDEF domain-containing protein [Aeromonas sp. A-5]|uniref:GGDEF domain-containing protein n=1 Tax=Aeromonas ichthyocola TaxID=3367746 RepID=UPI0038EAAF0C
MLVVVLLLLVMGMLALHQFNRSRKMQHLAMTDELTGLHNRRQIQAKGRLVQAGTREHGKTLSVLLLDIDHFKQVNDTLGHHMGDKVLAEVASCVAAQLRSLDRVGRNGGEEFLVLLPDTEPRRGGRGGGADPAIGSLSCASTGCQRGSRCTSASAVPSTAPSTRASGSWCRA